jgi:predicted RecB family nuclease
MITHLSQTSLQDYADCARRFQLRYLDRLAYPAEENEPALESERRLREGQDFHRLVQQSLLGIPADRLEGQAASPNIARWWRAWQDFKEEAGFGATGAVYSEITLSAALGGFRLLAKYDLISHSPGGRFLIYDWKTYRSRPTNEWLAARLQTRVYRALLAKGGSQLNGGQPIAAGQIEMVYWFAEFPSEPGRFSYNEAEHARDWAGLLTLASEIASSPEFPLTEDVSRCRLCTYRSYCNRGVEAGVTENIEAELDRKDVNLEQIQEIEF